MLIFENVCQLSMPAKREAAWHVRFQTRSSTSMWRSTADVLSAEGL
ncbi:MAG: hypothetical protein ACSHXK_02330 [Oceanococcus sp.]